MQLIICNDWTEQGSHEAEYQFAQTGDPRVLAVIQRDNDAEISQLYDGDAINPIHYHEHRHGAHWVAGYDDGSADVINRAFERFDDEVAERYLWIFHGIVFAEANSPGDYDGKYLVVTSPDYLKHIGNEPIETKAEALEDVISIQTDLQEALDGYVYGVGYATNPSRRLHDDEPIDLLDWDVEITCWGMVGEDYARSECFGFEEPDLPEMIEVPA